MRSSYNFLNNYEKRKLRNRKKLNKGGNKRLRISIFKSNKHFYVQLINDVKGVTLASASTLDSRIREICKESNNVEAIKQVSSLIVERFFDMKLNQQFVFDRGAYKYIGLVSKFAEALRSSGFKF